MVLQKQAKLRMRLEYTAKSFGGKLSYHIFLSLIVEAMC